VNDSPVTAARALLPAWVRVAGGLIANLQGPLLPAEQAAISRAVPARRASFAAGRTAARTALATFGPGPAPLPCGADGPPIWPPGLTGSITHGGDWCLAVVARLSDTGAVGIDIEPNRPLAMAIGAEVATPAERAILAGSIWSPACGGPGARPPGSATGRTLDTDAALALFSAKEAAYKAQFMRSRCMLGFHDLTAIGAADDMITLRLNRAAGPFAAFHRFAVRQAVAQGHLISAIALPA